MIDHLLTRRRSSSSLPFISELFHDMLAIPLKKLCVNLLGDYFMLKIDFSLLQDEYQPRLRCDVLKCLRLSISRQLTLQVQFHLALYSKQFDLLASQ
jgi:hypothetical protein